MASRLAVSSLRAAARPRVFASLPQAVNSCAAYSTQPPPAQKASKIIDKMPSSPGLLTKTGAAVLGTGLTAAAISQELYVVNEETVLLVGSLIMFTFIGKSIRGPYAEWAKGQIEKTKAILSGARQEHTQAVQERIDAVSQMKDVVPITKSLFELARETATLENETFVTKQKTVLAAEIKTVLDSWARFEQQQKEAEQADLTKSVISQVLASVKDEKTQREILASAVADVEQLVKSKAI
ncbi:hypothetical protein DL96DRAFT_535570 [Flagelloscypha sp. PMI_526]|nr:hypothetical protein DL96DRAFT_535570 [Flagelloscypha sp. PMI_526]